MSPKPLDSRAKAPPARDEKRAMGTRMPPLVVGRGRWKKDPGCGWSHDHPESGWQKNLLGGRGSRVFCLVDVKKTLWVSNPLAVAKNYSLFRGSKSNLPTMNAT